MLVLLTRKVEKKRSDRSQNRLLLSLLPAEYDEVMGITQMDPREAERFEEGVEPEFQDVEEVPK